MAPRRKFTEKQAEQIRIEYILEGTALHIIAERWETNPMTIIDVVRRRGAYRVKPVNNRAVVAASLLENYTGKKEVANV